jgi:phosphate-selective porin OprO/OprP
MNVKLRSLVAATLAGSFMMGFGANAVADSTDDIVNALIAKGVLTEEEGALLQKGRAGEKEAAEKKKETAVTGKIKDGTVVWESGDKSTSLGLTGRIQFDARSIEANQDQINDDDRDTKTLGDNFEIRRARIGAKGKMFTNFDYEVVGNLVGSNTNIIDVAYMNWNKYEPVQLRVGQFKQPFSLEQLTSSNNIDFMERSYNDQITPAKKPGIMVHGVPSKGLTYAVSTYQQNTFGSESPDSDGKSFAARGTVNFAELAGWKESVLHVGLSGFDSEYGVNPTSSSNTSSTASTTTRATIFGFRSGGRGLANAFRAQIQGAPLATADYNQISNYTANVENKAFGLELAAAQGPFKFQAEYTGQTFDASHVSPASSGVAATNNSVEADVKAYYVEALWMITGENYADWYKNGVWGGIKPKNNFDLETGKGIGAWEIGARFDQFEVDDTSVTGGRLQGSTTKETTGGKGGAETWTAGLKWTLNPNMRMMLNYSRTKYDTAFAPLDVVGGVVNDKEEMVMLRTQLAF